MRTILFMVGLLLFYGVSAEGYKISVELPKAAGKDVLLAHYFTTQVLINDTIRLDEKGKGVFKADTLLPQGLYKIYLDGDNHFDFLLSADQDFTIVNYEFANTSTQVIGAEESNQFAKYMIFLWGQQNKKKEIEEAMQNATEVEYEAHLKAFEALTRQLSVYWKSMAEQYPGTWLAKFLMSNYVPVVTEDSIPERIIPNDSLVIRYKFDYQKQHFFDYFDVADERFLYTPLLKPKIEAYFTTVLDQAVDSIRNGVIEIIEKSRPSKPMFRYLVTYFLNESNNSKLMGIDALFVEIARKYYLSGEAYWADSTTLAKIRENVMFTQYNLIGKTAPELKLESIDTTEYFSLQQVNAKITLLLIYEPDCSHCQEFVPALHHEVYQPYKNKGLAVYAIYSMSNWAEWDKFVNENGLSDWINVWDPNHQSGFKVLYDARKTPAIYVLDKDKKIIAKKVSVEQIKEILQFELGNP